MQAQHELSSQPAEHNHHDAESSMPILYGIWQFVLPPDLELKAVLDRIQVRLIAFKSLCACLVCTATTLLLPQGRAPPLFV